jgi:hypothetical protein
MHYRHGWIMKTKITGILNGETDLMIGSRSLTGTTNIPLYRRAGQKILYVFTSMGTQANVSDSQSGFRALSRNALTHLDFESDGYNVESDMIAHFARQDFIIKEIPITVRYDVPNSHKKNPVHHGFGMLTQLINLISYRRPLLAFGIPGGLLIITGLIAELWMFAELCTNGDGFHYVLTIGSAFIIVLGLLLVIAGSILNSLVIIVRECKWYTLKNLKRGT